MRSAFKCRLYPTAEQAAHLNRLFGCIRWVWNRSLAEREARYWSGSGPTSYSEASRALTAMRHDPATRWLADVASTPLQQALRHQDRAYTAFFKKVAGHPRFKSRAGRQSATFTRSAHGMAGGRLRLARIPGSFSYVWTWPDVDPAYINPTSVIVSREPDGRWFVAFAVEADESHPLPPTGKGVGVDLGVTTFATLSTGEKIVGRLREGRRERQLKRLQRTMLRREPGSANREKARHRVARAHAKIRDARRDFHHKASSSLMRRFDAVAIEDLNVAGMRSGKSRQKSGLRKAISQSGWGTFRTMLMYKASRTGRRLVVVDRFFPSSRTCSNCGLCVPKFSLDTRHWRCPECGARHDRDINAAKNIAVAAGLVETLNACGADVRRSGINPTLSVMNQEPDTARNGSAAHPRQRTGQKFVADHRSRPPRRSRE